MVCCILGGRSRCDCWAVLVLLVLLVCGFVFLVLVVVVGDLSWCLIGGGFFVVCVWFVCVGLWVSLFVLFWWVFFVLYCELLFCFLCVVVFACLVMCRVLVWRDFVPVWFLIVAVFG